MSIITKPSRILGLSLILLGLASAVWAKDVYVGAARAITTIDAALNTAPVGDRAVSGDTIWVDAGVYANYSGTTIFRLPAGIQRLNIYGPNWDINPNEKPRVAEAYLRAGSMTTLAGTTPSTVTIAGFSWEDPTGAVLPGGAGLPKADYLTFKHNRIINCTPTSSQNGGLFTTVSGLNYLTVTENLIDTVTGAVGSGMYLYYHNYMTISYNVIRNTNYAGIGTGGTYPPGNHHWWIIGNIIQNTPRQGIQISAGVGYAWILGNTIDNASYNNEEDRGGIRLYTGYQNNSQLAAGSRLIGPFWIQYNTISSSSNGIRVRACGQSSPESCELDPDYYHISHNNFINNEHYGISWPGALGVDGTTYNTPPTLLDVSQNFFANNGPSGTETIQGSSITTGTSNLLLTPQLPDSDGDGLFDWQEVFLFNTNPTNPDSDGDGFPDGVEVHEGTDPNGSSSKPAGSPPSNSLDSDGDGYSDLYEVEIGTDPNDPNSKPALGDINTNGMIENVDAIIIYNISLSLLNIYNYDFTRMDINRDGIINNLDAIILFNFFLENITIIPTT